MHQKRLSLWPKFDFPLLLALITLSIFGVVMIYSATLNPSGLDVTGAVPKQLAYLGVGLLLLFLFASVDYHYYAEFSLLFYAMTIISLVMVLGIGTRIAGARRWISLPFFDLQPSEIGKILFLLFLARFIATYESRINTPTIFLFSLLFALPPALLVFIEPDLGTALVYLAIWFGMTIAAGVRWRSYLVLALACAPALVWVWVYRISGTYQEVRLTCFINPYQAATSDCYNVIQATNAIANGGLVGQGYTQGALTQGGYVPIRYADFLFSVVGEELGLVGSIGLLLLIGIILLRILHVAGKAEDAFARYICVGIFSMLLFQTFVNVGMNIGIMPVTGITLPFMSYGGSSLVSKIIAIGIVESIAMRQGRGRLWYYNAGSTKV